MFRALSVDSSMKYIERKNMSQPETAILQTIKTLEASIKKYNSQSGRCLMLQKYLCYSATHHCSTENPLFIITNSRVEDMEGLGEILSHTNFLFYQPLLTQHSKTGELTIALGKNRPST